jgi:hypothetical protein
MADLRLDESNQKLANDLVTFSSVIDCNYAKLPAVSPCIYAP